MYNVFVMRSLQAKIKHHFFKYETFKWIKNTTTSTFDRKTLICNTNALQVLLNILK